MTAYKNLGDTIFFYFCSNNTSGSGDDGSSSVFYVRLAGDDASAAPVYNGSATLLSHGSYPAGCYEVAVPASVGNGFVNGNQYAVFCTLAVDSQNPSGFIGTFELAPVLANIGSVKGTNVNNINDFKADVSLVAQASVCSEARLARLDVNISSRSSHSATEVWEVTERTLTSFGNLVTDIVNAVWSATSRSLTSFGNLIVSIWSHVDRSLTEKTGFSLTEDQSTVTIGHCNTNGDMRGTDEANTVEPDPAGTIGTLIGSLVAALPSIINAEIVDALFTDAYGEPGQGNPPKTNSIAEKIQYLYKAWRNPKDNDGVNDRLYNDDGTVVDQKAAVSKLAGVVSIGKVISGAE